MIYQRDKRHTLSWTKPCMDYLIDTDADTAELPGNDAIIEGSMALSIESGKLFALTSAGWTEVA